MRLSDWTGEKLRETRESREFSQAGLARRSGVSKATISRYERGEIADPGVNTLVSLAKALGEKLDDVSAPVSPSVAPNPEAERALWEALDKRSHTLGDLNQVQTLVASVGAPVTAHAARALLDAAANLRTEGKAFSPGALALAVASIVSGSVEPEKKNRGIR